jgi:biopolymer transport protein ExbD
MVTTGFSKDERELDPATRVEEAAAKAGAADFEPAIVEVTSGAGGFVYRIGSRDFVDAAELTATLSQFPDKSNGAFVKVSDAVPYGMGAAAVQAARDAGYAVVSYIPTKGAP